MLVKSTYSRQGIQWCINKNPEILQSHNDAVTKSHKHVQFLPKRTKIGSIKAANMILVFNSIYYSQGTQ